MTIAIPSMFAAAAIVVAGGSFGSALLGIFLVVLIGLVVWALGRWIFPMLGMPATGMKIWDVIFVLLGALAFINFVAGLAGHPLVSW
jgi:hypothetical protein